VCDMQPAFFIINCIYLYRLILLDSPICISLFFFLEERYLISCQTFMIIQIYKEYKFNVKKLMYCVEFLDFLLKKIMVLFAKGGVI
jgi:hypothetical protein